MASEYCVMSSSEPSESPQGLIAAVDIGGTFTDAVAYDPVTGAVATGKSLTTHGALTEGVQAALEAVGFGRGVRIRELRHGSTIVINALLERRGAKTALVTTRGFEDVLFIGRGNVPVPYTLRYRRLPPYIEREDVFGVNERASAEGDILKRPGSEDIQELSQRLAAGSYDAVAICFLNSYQNGANEAAVLGELSALLPNAYVCASTEVSREWHEWSRMSTGVLNAYVGPIAGHYMRKIGEDLQRIATVDRVLATDSTGGLMSVERAARRPVNMVESGPASGVMAGVQVARECGIDHVLTLDMGGTTAKSALSVDGHIATVTEYWVNGYERGWPLQCSTIDIVEIGAGGGSIAWVDAVGALHVGPRSAGSMPGPAAYGLGGREATITDAHVYLGHIISDYSGSQIHLDPSKSVEALGVLAHSLDIGTRELAEGILAIANNHMAAMTRTLLARRGYDPRDFTIVAFGGSGPLHASAIARELGVRRVLVPAAAGVFSAFGMLLSDLRVDDSQMLTVILDAETIRDVQCGWERLCMHVDGELASLGAVGGPVRHVRSFDARYRGQDHVINVALGEQEVDERALREAFDSTYQQLYGHSDHRSDVQVTAVRVSGFKSVDRPARQAHPGSSSSKLEALPPGYILRQTLRTGEVVVGPRVILESGATCMLLAGDRASVLPTGDLVIDINVDEGDQ